VRAIQFSIIITSHNQSEYIREAVDSALSQHNVSKEIIVIDDSSCDGSQCILEKYGDRIKLVKLPENLGANPARNLGASKAIGEYLVFLDGDDALLPWALNVYEKIIGLKKPKVILSRILFFSGQIPTGKHNESPRFLEIVDYENLFRRDRSYRPSASAMVIDRVIFFDAKGWSSNIFPADDYDLMMRLGYSGRSIQILSPSTVFYRIHGNNTVHQIPKFIANVHKLINQERAGGYPGGRSCRIERYAFLGGPILSWSKNAYRKGYYGLALNLLASGWPMILAKILKKIGLIIWRHPLETIEMKTGNHPHRPEGSQESLVSL
jgi:glycosyltransferase involved in cell wall biosynthesis